MNNPLDQNEVELLHQQIAKLNYQMLEIASLLEARLGKASEVAVSARTIQQNFDRFARRMNLQPHLVANGLPTTGIETLTRFARP